MLESGASWIGYWLDRMDSVYAAPQGRTVPLKETPSFYFKRQCWISADPDETTLAAIIPIVGEDRFFWASDFPHPDHAPEYVGRLTRIAARAAAERARRPARPQRAARIRDARLRRLRAACCETAAAASTSAARRPA